MISTSIAVGPDGELLARGGAEGVGGGQQHAGARGGQVLGELADGRGLAGTVDPATMITVGPCWPLCRLSGRSPTTSTFCRGASKSVIASASRPLTAAGSVVLVLLHAALEVGQQEFGGLDAGVGHQQRGSSSS
jgi:hypothetical protein